MTRGTEVTGRVRRRWLTVAVLSAATSLLVGVTGQGYAASPSPTPAAPGAGTDSGATGTDAGGDTGSLTAQQQKLAGSLASASQDIATESAASARAVTQLEAVQAELPAAQTTVAAAKAKQVAAMTAVTAAEAAVAQTAHQLAVLAARTAAERTRIAQERAALDAAVRESYIAGPQGLARTVLNASDPGQLIDDSVALGRQGQDTASALQALNAAIAVLTQDTARATTDNEALLVQRKTAIAAASAAAQATSAAEASAEHLQSLVHQRAAAATAAQAQLSSDRAQYDELEQESSRITGLLVAAEARAAAAARPSTSTPGPSGLLWPTPGPVTSPFGYRVDPVTHVRQLHAGVDIGAPQGQAIMAAQAGVVAFAGQEQGYGNYTCIDHGGGFATCYAHQSAILVTVGETVARGQRIGLVGQTGYATGPHLHFETRVNGVPVDPLQYF